MADEIVKSEPSKPATRPGYRTTEFWLSMAAFLVGALIASGAIGETSALGRALAFVGSALAAAGYSWSRAVAKK